MRLITLNGIKLFVYLNGMILRYSDVAKGRLKKGWSEAEGSINNSGYVRARLNGKVYKNHRIIAYAFLGLDINNPKQIIDHIDKNRQNNNVNNLRIVSHQENLFNTNAKGYSNRGKKFQAEICINNKKINLGTFDTEEEANQAYLKEKEKYHIIPSTLN